MKIRDILSLGPVMPVIVIDQLEDAVPLAKRLLAKDVRVLEVTLRTPVALEAVKAIRAAVPEAVVGVGTIVNPEQLKQAKDAGAMFGVSPGCTPELLAAASSSRSLGASAPRDDKSARGGTSSRGPQGPRDLLESASDPFPFLPGVATASEVMTALAAGFDTMKFFPAEQAGGIAMLKAFAGPFPQVKFCPTGGIDASNMNDYLALPNVLCVGGSWIAK